jgi:hypothetical protein
MVRFGPMGQVLAEEKKKKAKKKPKKEKYNKWEKKLQKIEHARRDLKHALGPPPPMSSLWR